LYQELREKLHQKGATKRVEVEAIRYLDEIEARLRER
jgi:hypothetical protein